MEESMSVGTKILSSSSASLEPELAQLRQEPRQLKELCPKVAVAGVAFRKTKRAPEVLAVTGKVAGLFSLIGGEIQYGESINEALSRHFNEKLGCEIIFDCCYPLMVTTYRNPVMPNPARSPLSLTKVLHQVTIIYLVQINSDGNDLLMHAKTGRSGGEETSHGATWFYMMSLPGENKFALGQRYIFAKALHVAAERK